MKYNKNTQNKVFQEKYKESYIFIVYTIFK